jgi:tetratricopeptide (TPR) repeat protein
MSGFLDEAQPFVDRCLNEYPSTHTLAHALYIPAIRAGSHLKLRNPAAAIEVLKSAAPYDARDLGVLYLRASAYLAADRPLDAATEFQKVIDRRATWRWSSALVPIAKLGRARALDRLGDTAASRVVYGEFLAAWKDADPDLPILIAAKEEYERLSS